MKKVITTEKRPIKLWLNDLEERALDQAKNLANLPFTFKHVAIMPDSHMGYGMPIGGVLATKGVVIPNAVGVDIGCGMCTVKTDLTEISKDQLIKIKNRIQELVPVGFKHHSKDQDESLMPKFHFISNENHVIKIEYKNALRQLGTLGGGNHFIEIQKGSDGHIWIMVHSGSRNLGKKVADYYNKIAKKLNELWYSEIKSETQLSFLPSFTDEYNDYMVEMQYCVDFAFANRKLIVKRIMQAFEEVIPKCLFVAFKGNTITNIAHNYAQLENHFNTNVIIHRKGATSAKKGEIGIIPGSQGTKSYIVEGLGNKESFNSCSHGAGRVMGRKQAQKELNLESELKRMDDLGVIHDIKTEKDLDESAGAYKDIDLVMENQKDLVKILVELTPLAVIKG